MLEKDIAIVFDVGATNVRAVAVDINGEIIASKSYANETDADMFCVNGRIWDVDKIWMKLSLVCKAVVRSIEKNRIAGVTLTTFGVDGTFVDEYGNMSYPVISWQCNRTSPIMKNIDRYFPVSDLYAISGIYPFAFNTINKLICFKENRPDIIEKSDKFIFITSLLICKLTGVMKNDTTMMGTSMLADLRNRQFSSKILNALGFDTSLFGELVNPGDSAGEVTKEASAVTGLPEEIPVFFAGHDTQFAIFGSGAKLNQPVLSSGTWEILMTRSDSFSATDFDFANNLTTEADAVPGYYNIGQNWLGSGVLEWFSRHFYPGLMGDKLYNKMIGDARKESPGSDGILIDPSFYDTDSGDAGGAISGLRINTNKGKLYRAFLEGLSCRLREGLEALERAGGFKTEKIICVGGGSKNQLWNQIRADVCNVPVQLIHQKETTVLGASLFAFAGAKNLDPETIRENIDYKPEMIYPSENKDIYNDLYGRYLTFKNKI